MFKTADALVRGCIAYQGTDKREDYNNWYRPADGLLVTIKNDSRRSQGGILNWLDAVFYQWSEVCGGEPHKLRCIIQDRIKNKPSEAIVKEAHRLAGMPIEKGMIWSRGEVLQVFPPQRRLHAITIPGPCFMIVVSRPDGLAVLAEAYKAASSARMKRG